MKTSSDPRHKRREKIVKQLYEMGFRDTAHIPLNIKNITDKLKEIDEVITQCAPEWPINKLNRIDLAILRLALYELMIEKKTPIKVIIDEAVELGKQYGSENSSKFINGVLGTALTKLV